MKFVFVAVSVPALWQVREFERRYRERWPEGELAVECFYVAGREARYLLESGSSLKYYRHMEAILIPYRNTLKNKEKGNVGTDRKQGSQK